MGNKIIKGVNIIGHIKNETGLGEGSRLTIETIKNTKYNYSICNYDDINSLATNNDTVYLKEITNKIKYNISIINMNADQVIDHKEKLPKELWNTYKIGVWYWELEKFPDNWIEAFNYVDEIWAPTKFIRDSLIQKSLVPVLYMPPGLTRKEANKEYNRNFFHLPNNSFLFLNSFDMLSYIDRKNPLATIKAFKLAFKKNDNSVGLVLKINNYDKIDGINIIKKEIEGYNNIYLLTNYMSREEYNGLINVCDASVSLHRSEGLGLLCQESMYYGKPVIATAWSGNMDFMNSSNSCLVDYKLIKISEYFGDNNPDQCWAEANIDSASKYMIKLKENKSYYKKISKNAKSSITNKFSSKQCSKKIQKRLEMISNKKLINDINDCCVLEKESEYIYSQALKLSHDYANIEFNRFIDHNPIKKLIKKSITFIINPIVWEQKIFNTTLLRVVDELIENSKNNSVLISKYINKDIKNKSREIELFLSKR